MKKCVVLMSVAFCISLGAVRAQTNLVGEHIEGGWYYSLYDDYGEKTAILTHVLEALDVRDLQIPEEVFDLGSHSYYKVTGIGDGVFKECSSLRKVTLPPSVRSIGESAFERCDSLESINLENVSKIGPYAFYGCLLLSHITLGPLYEISDRVFSQCGIRSVTIPESVEKIGEYAFDGCDKLLSVTIPDNVESIGAYAFDGDGLCKLVIGHGVKKIGNEAFGSVIYEVRSLAEDPPFYDGSSMDGDLFWSGTYKYGILYVPEGKVDAYRNAPGWDRFVDIRDSEVPDSVPNPIKSITFDRDTIILIRDKWNNGLVSWEITPENASYPRLAFDVEDPGAGMDFSISVGSREIRANAWNYAFDKERPFRSDTATITARTTDGTGLSATCTVIYIMEQATTFSLQQDSIVIESGDAFHGTCVLLPQYASYVYNIEWKSSDESVARVMSRHWSNRNYGIRGGNPGTVTITARTTDGSNLCDSCVVTVLPSSTNIGQVEDPRMSVYASEGSIVVSGVESGRCVAVYNTAGIVVRETVVPADGRVEIALPAGAMYIVNVGGTTRKVVL